MRTKKLTEVQKKALTLLDDGASKDYHDFAFSGVNGACLARLVDLGLANVSTKPGGPKVWVITPEGRSALQTGRVKLEPSIARTVIQEKH